MRSSVSKKPSHHHSPSTEFDWEPCETTETAWSSLGPRRQAFGTNRGKGSRSNNFRAKKPTSRDSPAEESGYIVDSSPPPMPRFSRNSRALSDDSPCRTSEVTGKPLSRPSRYGRSTSVSDLPPTAPNPRRTRHSRSCSLVSRRDPTPERSFLSSTDEFLEEWTENKDPNGDDSLLEVESNAEDLRGRKKIRARRHSLSDTSPSHCFSTIAKSAEKTWKSNISDHFSPSKKTLDILGDSIEPGLSSPAQSTASSRKRGVCGSPISESDEWSTSAGLSASIHSSSSLSTRRTRSRSRVFSSVSGTILPSAPLAFERNEEDMGRMDIDSDDADTESSHGASSPDSSFHSTEQGHVSNLPSLKLHVDDSKIAAKSSTSEGNIIDNMPSDKDLKFLISALRKEKGGQKVMFSVNTSWSVSPPNSWTPSRRSGFLKWATNCLGFTIRRAGPQVVFLQISKTKGAEMLGKLESAMRHLMQMEFRPTTTEPSAPQGIFTSAEPSCSGNSLFASPLDARYVECCLHATSVRMNFVFRVS